jgi:hypothetical protein
LPQSDRNGIYIDLLEGHDKSLGYVDAIPYLTIDNSQRLKHENQKLKVRKDEIQQVKEELELLKKAIRDHINAQVKESLKPEGVKLSEALVDILYKSEKADIRRAVAKYARDNNIEVDFGLSELT